MKEKVNAVPRNWAMKIREMSKYKFNLAFENGVVEDYVTEKFAQVICVWKLGQMITSPCS